MNKPTRDEVEWIKLQALTWLDKYDADVLVNLCNAYLAQEGELDNLKIENDAMIPFVELVDKLEEENKVLKASMEAEYIERQAKHIQELVKENMALKADIEKHENGYGYLLATGQAERGEMRKRNRRETNHDQLGRGEGGEDGVG